jgi:ubiquinone/menaquinone biosynthesis C-methylase UbiE
MKARESGMPEERLWLSFFTPTEVLRKLDLPISGDLVDFGCGYGTFTIPAAQITCGTVYALDIDPEMTAATQIKTASLPNVRVCLRDFLAEGSGLRDTSVNYVMLFNILHMEDPDKLLKEAYRILIPGGKLGITHWNYDPNTPRGPSMEIRPRPEQCQEWAETIGFSMQNGIIDLPPHHYGMVLVR